MPQRRATHKANAAQDAAFGQGHRQSAIGAVVRRQHGPIGYRPAAQLLNPLLQPQIDVRPARHPSVHHLQILAAGQVGGARLQSVGAQQHHRKPLSRKCRPDMLLGIFKQSQPSHDRGRVNRLTLGLVVQADVAADHRHAQDTAGPGHAPNALLQLVVDFGTLWIAKVKTIGKGQGFGPTA